MAKSPLPRAALEGRDQQLRVFYSVDLAGSTAFKARRAVPTRHPNTGEMEPAWPDTFDAVFRTIQEGFLASVDALRGAAPKHLDVKSMRPTFWKMNGDELLFVERVVDEEATGYPTLHTGIRAFTYVVHELDSRLKSGGLGVKGCIWTAGFPIRNREIRLPLAGYGRPSKRPQASEGSTLKEYVDYIGPEIDAGFRLAAITPAGQVSLSVDAAWLSTFYGGNDAIRLHLVGWRRLRGVFGDHPYPIFWTHLSEDTEADRIPWEGWRDTDSGKDDLTAEFRKVRATPKTAEEVKMLLDAYREVLAEFTIRPYTNPDKMPGGHRTSWLERATQPILLQHGAEES